jgi:cytochrome c551/c552
MPTVFKAKCAVCHSLDKDMTGPKLRNILDRVPSEEWFDAFVQYEDSLVNANDPYTIEVQKWSPVRGNHNSELKDEELKELKEYLSQKKSQQ